MSADQQKQVMSSGKPERVTFMNKADEGAAKIENEAENIITEDQKKKNIEAGLNEDGSAKNNESELTEEKKKANIEAGLNEDGTAIAPAKLSDEQLQEEYKKRFPETPAETPEQIKAKEQAFEKRMLDHYIEHGGTVDDFALLKQVASADLSALSESELELELTKAGFNEEEKKVIRQERYYQLDDEEINTLDDEAEKELAKKKKEFGTSKLKTKAEQKQKLAVGFFENLKRAIAEEDAEVAQEKELAQKVDSHFEALPRKMTLELGKTKDKIGIDPIEFNIPDEAIAEVRDLLKTADKRNQILYNQDGSINIVALSNIMIRNKVLEAALNESYLTGVSRNTAEFEKIFPIRNESALGAGLNGGSGLQKTKGKIASFGKAQRVDLASAK